MGRIPDSVIDEVLAKADIADVVGNYVALKSKGTNMWGLCPFHDEKTPSFSVNPSKGIFKCFGCGKSGSAVGFLMEHEHSSYAEALRYIAKRYNIEVVEEEESPEESLEGLSIEEVAGLEKPDYIPPEKEDLNAMVEEFFGLSGGDGESAPAPEEDGEEIRVYQPSKDKKDRQPIPIPGAGSGGPAAAAQL